MGTHNRIVPLGGGYLELLAVADAEEAAGSALGRAVTERLASVGEGLMGWAVATDDVAAVAARLGTELVEIRRQGFAGRLTGVAEAMAEPCLPFFVERGRDVAAPGRAAATPAGSRGSRWPATRRGSTPGWAARRSPSACGRARPRCSRWGSESSGYRDRGMTSNTIQTRRLRTHYVESGPEDGSRSSCSTATSPPAASTSTCSTAHRSATA